MKLIASLTSPYARKVRIVLAEKKIDCPLEEDVPWNADTRVGDYNPLGKVPVLELDDGSTLYDSRVIAEYLDNISPVSRILPQENRLLIATRRWEALADGIVDAAVAIVLEKRRPDDKQMPEAIARQRGKIDRGLAALAADLADRQWCNGVSYSLADIAVGACLGYLDFRFPEIDWRDSHPNLASLLERLMTRPSFADTLPPVA
ncbi:glutathione S-transferase [Chromobacterium alkanivorans]|uniref:glutathione S-transferase n=1 Tax=Chromobacterium alkanivorans TaxID=1071719 RepID=UPI00196829E2|nr:glutathione S-transferase [Chromobacterium alkanivorans]MBN3004667.1 glutathione S-transferase [Chromobacterium alkanivorans]MCS3804905.1 glutathione S-transferase [Chromobacterium alkanivorans]MCS3819532.1 glutathione S-transferase [Chromobacterium alkanivorans]MCS3874044.1 glutathione S-transferase [Chromobacterium alkanivorans]